MLRMRVALLRTVRRRLALSYALLPVSRARLRLQFRARVLLVEPRIVAADFARFKASSAAEERAFASDSALSAAEFRIGAC